jgi:hypothetical protein
MARIPAASPATGATPTAFRHGAKARGVIDFRRTTAHSLRLGLNQWQYFSVKRLFRQRMQARIHNESLLLTNSAPYITLLNVC